MEMVTKIHNSQGAENAWLQDAYLQLMTSRHNSSIQGSGNTMETRSQAIYYARESICDREAEMLVSEST